MHTIYVVMDSRAAYDEDRAVALEVCFSKPSRRWLLANFGSCVLCQYEGRTPLEMDRLVKKTVIN